MQDRGRTSRKRLRFAPIPGPPTVELTRVEGEEPALVKHRELLGVMAALQESNTAPYHAIQFCPTENVQLERQWNRCKSWSGQHTASEIYRYWENPRGCP